MAEIGSDQPGYRRFRYTEQNHTSVPIHPGDRFQIVSVDIAIGHLSDADRQRCLKMDVIASVEADGGAIQRRETVAELIGD
jgi:hypothetical protein